MLGNSPLYLPRAQVLITSVNTDLSSLITSKLLSTANKENCLHNLYLC